MPTGSPISPRWPRLNAYGLAKNHPFVDGNKRVSFFVTELFLDLNGFELTASDADCVATWLGLAAGEIGEAALAQWLANHMNQGKSRLF